MMETIGRDLGYYLVFLGGGLCGFLICALFTYRALKGTCGDTQKATDT
jgi:hypothetical protein